MLIITVECGLVKINTLNSCNLTIVRFILIKMHYVVNSKCLLPSASLGNPLITFEWHKGYNIFILLRGYDGLRWNLPRDVLVPGFGGNLDLSLTNNNLNSGYYKLKTEIDRHKTSYKLFPWMSSSPGIDYRPQNPIMLCFLSYKLFPWMSSSLGIEYRPQNNA